MATSAAPPSQQPTRKQGGKARRFISGAKNLFSNSKKLKQRNQSALAAVDYENFCAAMASLTELDQFLQIAADSTACATADVIADTATVVNRAACTSKRIGRRIFTWL